MDVYEKLKELGLQLPPAPAKGGVYSPSKRAGNLIFISGCGPAIGGNCLHGKLGGAVSLEEGQACARDCMLNVLAVLQAAVGDLNKVTPIKILTFVAGTDSFDSQPQVANGGSELLLALFGDVPARSAIGVNALPGDIPVETEAIFEVKE